MNASTASIVLGALTLLAATGSAADLTRAQFSKAELDTFGYPTNSTQAKELGRSEARQDLSNGVVRVPNYGLPLASSAEYDRILEGKYKIGRLGLGGCIVSQGLVAYADGYSEVSRLFIEQKYGTNIWKETQAAAEKAWEARSQHNDKTVTNKQIYRIRAGDTLSRIAHGQGVTVKSLQAANPGLNPTRLQINQAILIPAKAKP